MRPYISTALRTQVRTRFANCCAYCHTNENLTVAIFEIEHIVPISKGGDGTFENLCLACPTCNRYKASRQTAVDPDTGDEAKFFHPQQHVWQEHFVWNHDSTQLVGLTSKGRATIAALKMNRPQLQRVRNMWVKMGEHPPIIDAT